MSDQLAMHQYGYRAVEDLRAGDILRSEDVRLPADRFGEWIEVLGTEKLSDGSYRIEYEPIDPFGGGHHTFLAPHHYMLGTYYRERVAW